MDEFKSPWRLLRDARTTCSDCKENVYLMTGIGLPMFYICFRCKRVSHVGVGVLDRDDSNDH